MHYEYLLLSEIDPNKLTERVNELRVTGWRLHGELATCPWTDRLPVEQQAVDTDYCMLFQWVVKETPQ